MSVGELNSRRGASRVLILEPKRDPLGIEAGVLVALLNRVGEVNETTNAVLYLATAKFTTGHILRVDGGYVTGRL